MDLIKVDNDIIISENTNRKIEGWASVDIVDASGEKVNIDSLAKLMPTYIERGGILNDSHSGRHIGKVTSWEMKMNKDAKAMGVYIYAYIFKNLKIDDDIWEMIKNGIYKGFSVGGQDFGKYMECEDRCYNKIDNLEIWEISVVPSPANKASWITDFNKIAKSEDLGAIILKKLENNLISKMDIAISNSKSDGINSVFNDMSKIKEQELLDKKLELTDLFIEKLRRNNARRT